MGRLGDKYKIRIWFIYRRVSDIKHSASIRMITTTTTALLCLAISGVTGYNYQAVSTCPAILGDPTFTTSTVTGVVRKIYATTSEEDAVSDRCVSILQGVFYVTRVDSAFTILKFKSLFNEGSGTFTEIAPDGNTYTVIVLKRFGSECGNMNLLVRCSDFVGNANLPTLVKIHADVDANINTVCLKEAKLYAESVLGHQVNFKILSNSGCSTISDFCPK